MEPIKDHSQNYFLGNMEPISQSKRDRTPDRRQISIQWFLGLILISLASFMLMGGALFAALDRNQQLIVPASPFSSEYIISSSTKKGINAIRGNRLNLKTNLADKNSNIMMVPTIKRNNDRDVIQIHPFMVMKTLLSITPKKKAIYPKFNPLTIFSETDEQQPISKSRDSIYGAEVENEFSVRVIPFPYEDSQITPTPHQNIAEVERLVHHTNPTLEGNTVSIASLLNIDPTRFSTNANEPLITPGVVITTENVSVKNRTIPKNYAGERYDEHFVKVPTDVSVMKILKAEGVDASQALKIQNILSADLGSQNLRHGDKIRLAYQISPKGISIFRVSIYRGVSHIVSIARSDNSKFVYAREPVNSSNQMLSVRQWPILSGKQLPSVYNAINRMALSEGMTPELTKLLTQIFAFDVDFQSKVKPLDELVAFISLEDGKTAPGKNSEILFASIKLNQTTRKYYRFRDSKTGHIGYYDENGKSAKKFLLRKPLPNGRFSSPFGFRIHPISRIRKMHWGADWSAARGSPIIAAGDGVIEKAGWAGGNGKKTIIRHANGYKTSYSHQTAFAKGIVSGARVRQGQIIGYVGSTGFSTGPHLHYEVEVNKNRVNPMRIRLPKEKVLKGKELALFETERNRIDALLEKYENDSTHLALN